MAVNIGSTVKEVLDEINNGTGGGGGEVGNGTITIKQAGVTKGTFTTNQSGDTTIELANSAVNQIHTTTDGNHPLLFKFASGNTSTSQTTNGTKFSNSIYANPSTGTIYANDFVVDGQSIVGGGGGSCVITDLGEQEDNGLAEYAILDLLKPTSVPTGKYLYTYNTTCRGDAVIAICHKNEYAINITYISSNSGTYKYSWYDIEAEELQSECWREMGVQLTDELGDRYDVAMSQWGVTEALKQASGTTIVNFTYDEDADVFSCDKTQAEIYEILNNGGTVVGKFFSFQVEAEVFFNVTKYTEDCIVFVGETTTAGDSITKEMIKYYDDNTIDFGNVYAPTSKILYRHSIRLYSLGNFEIHFDYYSSNSEQIKSLADLSQKDYMTVVDGIPCSGIFYIAGDTNKHYASLFDADGAGSWRIWETRYIESVTLRINNLTVTCTDNVRPLYM